MIISDQIDNIIDSVWSRSILSKLGRQNQAVVTSGWLTKVYVWKRSGPSNVILHRFWLTKGSTLISQDPYIFLWFMYQNRLGPSGGIYYPNFVPCFVYHQLNWFWILEAPLALQGGSKFKNLTMNKNVFKSLCVLTWNSSSGLANMALRRKSQKGACQSRFLLLLVTNVTFRSTFCVIVGSRRACFLAL